MPVYLVHGFRWQRDGHSGIRVHAIVNNLDDCSVEYIQNESSRDELLHSFRKNYTEIMRDLEASGNHLQFIEQYDPEDMESVTAVSQPYAFVADKVVELAGQSMIQSTNATTKKEKPELVGPSLSANIEDVIADGPGLTPQAWEALAELRDKIATGEKIGWWVVYNGDPERAYDSDEEEEESDEEDEGRLTPTQEFAPYRTTPREKKRPEPPPKQQRGPPVPPKSPSTPSSIGTKLMPIRSRPEAVLPSPTNEQIPDPTKAKEAAKSSGFRKKFFGKKV